MKYEIAEDVRIATNSPMFGPIRLSFKAGTHEARSDQEEVALQALVRKGLAEVVESKPTAPAKKKGGG